MQMNCLSRRSLLGAGCCMPLLACGSEAEPKPTDPGAPAPGWKLQDFQPASDRYTETYGLDAFRGTPVLVALLSGSCNTCGGIAYLLNDLQQQWLAEGLVVTFCAINSVDDGNGQFLIDQCAFPLFQDDPATNAWSMHGGTKDDIFVYSSGGLLVEFFRSPRGTPVSAEGTELLKDAALRGL
jgi:hypothetical protein